MIKADKRAKMQVVIEIHEKIYKKLATKEENIPWDYVEKIMTAITYGTPLPKGHGRLIDAGALKFYEIDEIGGEYNPYLGCSKEQIDEAPTIIEADKESE